MNRSLLLFYLCFMAGPLQAQPLLLPGAQPPTPAGNAPPTVAEKPRQSARPAALKTASEGEVEGRVLKLNGTLGTLRIQAVAKGVYAANVSLEGLRLSNPAEACAVEISGAAPVALTPLGRPEGSLRYRLNAPICPLSFDILNGAILVREPQTCRIEAADCRIDPLGLWGPEAPDLLARAKLIEQARGQADKSVQDHYRHLTQKASAPELRDLASEQAAFSAIRDTICRPYARENAHGFCHARFTEARANALRAKMESLPKER